MPARSQGDPGPGMGGEDNRLADLLQCCNHRAKSYRLHVGLPVECEEEVRAGLDAGLGERVRAVAGERCQPGVRVHHHVADLADTFEDPLPAEILDSGVAGTEKERGEVVDQDPVQLFGHRSVERAKPGLDVRHRDT